jgi:hypothetical protein
MRYLRYIKYGYIYIYGINMAADDESIIYKYDAKATKYGDLLFFWKTCIMFASKRSLNIGWNVL